MDRRTKQLIKNIYYDILISRDECHFQRREKSVYYLSKRFLSLPVRQAGRGLLRNDKSKKLNSSMIAAKIFLLSSFLSASLLFLISCANQLPPGGGEVDKISPEIISSYPENGTINYDKDFIEIEFSEYVDKRSFKEALFISPAIEDQPEISWSGKSVEIVFPNGLKNNLTYVVTIGTDVVDVNNKNRMANSYSFSFATGNKIDKRTINGIVYGKDIEGTFIFAYKYSYDTTKYLTKKPDYISQVGKNGSYKLNGLAESVYRVFAIKDQMRDFKFQADQDLIGIPFKDISLIGNDSSFIGLNFFLQKIDTLSPRLISTVMTDRNHILVTLSEECDSSNYKSQDYFIYDSTSNASLNIEYCYKGNTKKDEMILIQKNELNPSNRYYLFAKKLKDLSGNIFSNDWRELIISDKSDTTAPKLFKKIPEQNTAIDFINANIIFYFDDALQNKQIKNAILFLDTLKNKIPFEIYFPDDATLIVKPLSDLKPDKKFEIKLDLSKVIDAAGNKIDSIYTHKFSTISGIEFTGLSGKVITSKENLVLVLQGLKNQNNFYITKPDKTSNYSFQRIQPGSYALWYYVDKDSSGTYDYGWQSPYRNSEEFYYYQDTIKLKPRWSITDFNIKTK